MSAGMRTLRACASLFGIKLKEELQYRLSALSGAMVSIFWALIEITVYSVFYAHAQRAAAPGVAALSLEQLVSYVWLGQFLFLMQPMSNPEPTLLGKIDSGDVGLELCRPLHLHSHWLARIAAARVSPLIWRGSIVLIAGLLMPPAYRLGPPASLVGALCALAAALGALMLCASFGTLVMALRLDVRWGNGPMHMVLLVGSVLSGTYLPLQLWPDAWQRFLLLQPFAGYCDIPLRLYLGSMPPSQALGALALQLGWVLAFALMGRAVMNRRLKNIVVQGG